MNVYVVMVATEGLPDAYGAWPTAQQAGVQQADLRAAGHDAYTQEVEWMG